MLKIPNLADIAEPLFVTAKDNGKRLGVVVAHRYRAYDTNDKLIAECDTIVDAELCLHALRAWHKSRGDMSSAVKWLRDWVRRLDLVRAVALIEKITSH